MGNYAAFGFGRPRFGNWATHGLGVTTFVPPPPEPTFPPDRTFIVVGEDAIPVMRDATCVVVGEPACFVPGDPVCTVARPIKAKVRAGEAARVRRADVIRVRRVRPHTVKRED